uniref:Uncharacterized protein n=1 Tax=Octopus bimaculoides TaxID=37653 RepID=A0A0L8FPS8_OCTBM
MFNRVWCFSFRSGTETFIQNMFILLETIELVLLFPIFGIPSRSSTVFLLIFYSFLLILLRSHCQSSLRFLDPYLTVLGDYTVLSSLVT